MKLRKMMAILLAGVIMTSTMAGCGGDKSEKTEETQTSQKSEKGENDREPITIEFMLLNNQSGDGEKFVLKDIVKEKFNIDLKL